MEFVALNSAFQNSDVEYIEWEKKEICIESRDSHSLCINFHNWFIKYIF